MALIVNLRCVENLHGKSDRIAKVTFRGKVLINAKAKTAPVKKFKEQSPLIRDKDSRSWEIIHSL